MIGEFVKGAVRRALDESDSVVLSRSELQALYDRIDQLERELQDAHGEIVDYQIAEARRQCWDGI